MIPVRAAGHDLQLVHRSAGRLKSCQCIGLGIEHADGGAVARPMPPGTVHCRRAAPNAAGHAALAFIAVVLIGARHLEQRHIGIATRGVALGGCDKARQQ